MEKAVTVIQVVAPIFTAIFLGILAKRKQAMSQEEVRGLQQFVMNYGVPCVIFNSCLSANIGAESVSSMVLVLPVMLLGTLWAFRARKKQFPYHNFPQLFSAQETGMLGIPLFMILFGADQAYRVGILDLTQAVTAFPTIAILSASAGEDPSPKQIAKKVASSPMLIMAVLGLTLNLTGRLVSDKNIGLASKRHSNNYTLSHSSREFEWILLHTLLGLVDIYKTKHLYRSLFCLRFVSRRVEHDRFHQLMSNSIGGIK